MIASASSRKGEPATAVLAGLPTTRQESPLPQFLPHTGANEKQVRRVKTTHHLCYKRPIVPLYS